MSDKYILDEKGNPVLEPDIIKWARWIETAERHVAKERIHDCKISTVFLGIDYDFFGSGGRPVLWETMVFGGPFNQVKDRCAGSREQAEAMHARMIEKVKGLND